MTSSATGFAPPIVEPGPAVHDFDFSIGAGACSIAG